MNTRTKIDPADVTIVTECVDLGPHPEPDDLASSRIIHDHVFIELLHGDHAFRLIGVCVDAHEAWMRGTDAELDLSMLKLLGRIRDAGSVDLENWTEVRTRFGAPGWDAEVEKLEEEAEMRRAS